ncbi:MAG: hypothetical protein RR766_00120 [Longicatena sp.]
MKKKEKTEDQVFVDKMLYIIISIPLLSAMFMYMFSYFFQFPQSPLVGSIDGWLGFTGGVIGGTLTLFGVSITLREQNKLRNLDEEKRDNERKELLAIQYKPMLSSSKSLSPIDLKIKNHDKITNIICFGSNEIERSVNDCNKGFHFKIYNKGRGEAYITKITPHIESNVPTLEIIEPPKGYDSVWILKQEEELQFIVLFQDKLKYLENIKDDAHPLLGSKIRIVIDFTDLLHFYDYSFTFETTLIYNESIPDVSIVTDGGFIASYKDCGEFTDDFNKNR